MPAIRFLLLEVPGPWPQDARTRLDATVMDPLAAAAGAAGTRLLLIRRPGRHPAEPGRENRWALADTRPGIEAVQWGSWREEHELAALDPAARLDPAAARASGPQEVALVCTHGSRDVCCAVRGRPVASALGEVPGLDVWESTHVGGCRFAANAVLLPTGDMVGGLDPDSAGPLIERWRAGRLDAAHHRGRCGSTPLAQAVARLVAEALGEDRPGEVSVRSTGTGDRGDRRAEAHHAEVDHAEVEHAGRRYRAVVAVEAGPPLLLTCAAAARGAPSRARAFRLVSLDPLS